RVRETKQRETNSVDAQNTPHGSQIGFPYWISISIRLVVAHRCTPSTVTGSSYQGDRRTLKLKTSGADRTIPFSDGRNFCATVHAECCDAQFSPRALELVRQESPRSPVAQNARPVPHLDFGNHVAADASPCRARTLPAFPRAIPEHSCAGLVYGKPGAGRVE